MTTTITTTDKTATQTSGGPWWRSRQAMAIAGAGFLLLLIVWLIVGLTGGDGAGQDGPTYRVTPGPLIIHVTESGTIQAREQIEVRCEVEGRTTITYLIEEGTRVQQGDLLVELDASDLQTNLVDLQIQVDNADAAFIRAREKLAITRSKGESDVAKAELDYEFAGEDLKKYVQGEYPKENQEMQAKIKLAEADLQDAQRTAEWSIRLYEEKYISETDKTRDELRRDRAKLDLDTAKANLALLEDFTYKRRVRQLESDVEQNRMALERARRQATANNVQDKADLSAKESELARRKTKLTKLKDQLSKTQIHAPVSGMAIYATTGRENWRRNNEPLAVGQEVHEREVIIFLPTADSMMANIKVHESSVKKIEIGQPAQITINALPGKEYTGKVKRIAPLPDAQNFWRGNPDLKVFNTEIDLDGKLDGVRTGMSCKVRIVIDQFQDVLSVPVQSVIRIDDQPTLYVKRGRGFSPVEVELGQSNQDYTQIISGLSSGDRVLLTPPLDKAGNTRPRKPGPSKRQR